jgi:23S rRNA pseudouridine2605 synthase
VVGAPERTRVWRYHKPRGKLTTNRDPQGRPTIYEDLPRGIPRVISVGRLDFNSEGLLLLTNDGALARELELPDTAWVRRYRVRAFGRIGPAEIARLAKGMTISGIRYGAIEAELDREQGDNVWVTMALREGKNREIRKVLEALGLKVSRLIRTAYGPFQLGRLEPGEIEEVPGKVLTDQLGRNPGTAGAKGRPSSTPQPTARPRTAVLPDDDRPARPTSKTSLRSDAPRSDKPWSKAPRPTAQPRTPARDDENRSAGPPSKPPRRSEASRSDKPWSQAPRPSGSRTDKPRSDRSSAKPSLRPDEPRSDKPGSKAARPSGSRPDKPRADKSRPNADRRRKT